MLLHRPPWEPDDVRRSTAARDRRVIDEADRRDPVNGGNHVDGALVERGGIRRLRISGRRCNLKSHEVLGVEPQVHLLHAPETLHEQSGGCEQRDGQRELRNAQRVADRDTARTAGTALAAVAKLIGHATR